MQRSQPKIVGSYPLSTWKHCLKYWSMKDYCNKSFYISATMKVYFAKTFHREEIIDHTKQYLLRIYVYYWKNRDVCGSLIVNGEALSLIFLYE